MRFGEVAEEGVQLRLRHAVFQRFACVFLVGEGGHGHHLEGGDDDSDGAGAFEAERFVADEVDAAGSVGAVVVVHESRDHFGSVFVGVDEHRYVALAVAAVEQAVDHRAYVVELRRAVVIV